MIKTRKYWPKIDFEKCLKILKRIFALSKTVLRKLNKNINMSN